MMEITNTTVEDYADMKIMPMGRAGAIAEALARYLLEQAKKGREYAVLEDDGTMMHCPTVNTIDPNAWKYGDTPDDYYNK